MPKNNMTFRLAGEAGQGVESSGAGFTKALARGGLHVFGLQDYMSRIRGGNNFFQIRVAEHPLYSHTDELHLLLALNEESIERYRDEVAEGGGIIYDEQLKIEAANLEERGIKAFRVPLAKIAQEEGGSKVMANTAALGATAGVTKYGLEQIEGVIRDNFARKGDAVVTAIAENNQVYGLTKGQYSPTSDRGFITSTTPEGAIEMAFNPLALALATGATFIARGFSGDPRHLAGLIVKAIQHKGFALVDVLQPCVIFNRVNTYDWYRARVYKLDEEEGYDLADKTAAWEKAQEWGERIPLGVIYQVEGLPSYEEQVPALAAGPLVRQPLACTEPSRSDGRRAEEYEALKEELV